MATMIEQLLIQNFQAHGKLRVQISPGITCIVGPSDVGKSAILRALRWVVTNQPGGDAYIRCGTKGATVKLKVDGHTITRRRSPGGNVNEYYLDDQQFKAFGRDVPEPIEQLLNLGGVSWQWQHDAPYWFGETAGEVSRQLNTIVNLEVIDTALAGVARTLHRARAKLELAEGELTTANQDYAALAWVPEFEAAVSAVEAAETRHTAIADKAAKAAGAVRGMLTYQATSARATAAATAGRTAVCAGTKALDLQRRAGLLSRLAGRAREFALRLSAPVPPVKPMEEAFGRYTDLVASRKILEGLVSCIKEKETELCQAKDELRVAKAALPKLCPTCGQSVWPIFIYRHGHQ